MSACIRDKHIWFNTTNTSDKTCEPFDGQLCDCGCARWEGNRKGELTDIDPQVYLELRAKNARLQKAVEEAEKLASINIHPPVTKLEYYHFLSECGKWLKEYGKENNG